MCYIIDVAMVLSKASIKHTSNVAGLDVVIGVSDPRRLLSELPEALAEAREAINVGGIYRSDERLLIYRRLMLERFLTTVPRTSGLSYGSMVFNARTARLFNEEIAPMSKALTAPAVREPTIRI